MRTNDTATFVAGTDLPERTIVMIKPATVTNPPQVIASTIAFATIGITQHNAKQDEVVSVEMLPQNGFKYGRYTHWHNVAVGDVLYIWNGTVTSFPTGQRAGTALEAMDGLGSLDIVPILFDPAGIGSGSFADTISIADAGGYYSGGNEVNYALDKVGAYMALSRSYWYGATKFRNLPSAVTFPPSPLANAAGMAASDAPGGIFAYTLGDGNALRTPAGHPVYPALTAYNVTGTANFATSCTIKNDFPSDNVFEVLVWQVMTGGASAFPLYVYIDHAITTIEVGNTTPTPVASGTNTPLQLLAYGPPVYYIDTIQVDLISYFYPYATDTSYQINFLDKASTLFNMWWARLGLLVEYPTWVL